MEQQKEDEANHEKQGGIRVSLFDHSIQNHFNAMSTVYNLTKQIGSEASFSQNDAEFAKLSSSITFFREWKDFNYKPRKIKFNFGTTRSEKEDHQAIVLPQFSSATVPKSEDVNGNGNTASVESREDFIMNVGGSVWAMDWCPRDHEKIDFPVKLEFLAVATHPPESYYHKLGAVLTGRGLVQIWCVINPNGNKEEEHAPAKRRIRVQCKEGENSNEFKRPRGRPRKTPVETIPEPKKPKGRPRKKPINESAYNLDEGLSIQPGVVQCPEEEPSGLTAIDGGSMTTQEPETNVNRRNKRKISNKEVSASIAVSEAKPGGKWNRKAREKTNQIGTCEDAACPLLLLQHEERETKNSPNCEDAACPSLLTQSAEDESSNMNQQMLKNSDQKMATVNSVLNDASMDVSSSSCLIPEDVALPRVVLCVAHNGKVAWDVKWRPFDKSDSICQYRMGFLAVLLGNGSLEVWDIPLPHAVNSIYPSSSCKDSADPRFVKLKPVFRCLHLKLGETQSIPLTIEWSTSCFQDYLLAGCHDGMVALWKFSISDTSLDARPLLFFSADTNPIRAVSWAPMESDQEGSNIIVTAGQFNLKFWDIRDPFRPLWDIQTSPRFICSMDWLPDPRCIVFSCDDGTMKLLSLVKAAYDSNLEGKPSAGPKTGLNVFNFSSSSIWSIQVSKLTAPNASQSWHVHGLAAYCCADGTVKRFQLTRNIVEKDPSRHQVPHFVCGWLSEDDSVITVNTPEPDVPLNLKKPPVDVREKPKTIQCSNQDKRTKAGNKVSETNDKILSLGHGKDAGAESEDDETLACFVHKSRKKPTKNSKEKAAEDQPPTDKVDENSSEKQNGRSEAPTDIESMPSKLVAMHRVRWNMNKGSEKWLCSGGAAGIVRCQEIKLSGLDMKLPRRR